MAAVSTSKLIKRAFLDADAEDKGFITPEELQNLMKSLGDYTQEQLDVLLSQIDKNGDGNVDYNEFIAWIMRGQEGEEAKELGSKAAQALEGLGNMATEDHTKETFVTPERGNYDAKSFPADGSWRQVLEAAQASGEPFTDSAFPPDESMLYREGDKEKKKYMNYAGLEFKRIWELSGGEGVLIKRGMDARDIGQGRCGDCYFMAALASVANSPGFLSAVFPGGQQVNPQGVYAVRFYRDGAWRVVVVDDYLAVQNGKTLFARPRGDWWVPIVEKAWAKLNGSYAAIDGGQFFNIGWALTGCLTPKSFSVSYSTKTQKDKDRFWEQLRALMEKGSVLGCSTGSKKAGQQGLVRNHAYSILDLLTVRADGQEVRLVHLRNPWAHGLEWRGAWSDRDKAWDTVEEEDREAINLRRGDGLMFMAFDDWCSMFTTATACVAWPTDKFKVFHVRTEILEEGENPCFLLTPPEGGKVNVRFNMQDFRGLYGEEKVSKGAFCVLRTAEPGHENPKTAPMLRQQAGWRGGAVEGKVASGSSMVIQLKPHFEEKGKKDRSQRVDLGIIAPLGSVLRVFTEEEMAAFSAEAETDPEINKEKLALKGVCEGIAGAMGWDSDWVDGAMVKLEGLSLLTVDNFVTTCNDKKLVSRSINCVFNRIESQTFPAAAAELQAFREMLMGHQGELGWDDAYLYSMFVRLMVIGVFDAEAFGELFGGEADDVNELFQAAGMDPIDDKSLELLLGLFGEEEK